MVTLADVHAARERITGHVRRTPMIAAHPVKQPITEARLTLKLECTQVIGSFKARGASNKLYSLPREQVERGIIAASGGNHGLGVAYAGWMAQCPVTIYLPHNTPKHKAHKLQAWDAQVIFEGDVWDDSNRAALAAAESQNLAYFHPFADPLVIAGQGTVGLEILEDLPDVDVLLVAIGGGGLISGIGTVLKALKPDVTLIGIEATGAPTLYASRKAGHLVELDAITTRATTLAPRKSESINFEHIERTVDDIVLVTDEEMTIAAQWLWFELGVGAELSAAASIAALMTGKVTVQPNQNVCALICGAGTDGMV